MNLKKKMAGEDRKHSIMDAAIPLFAEKGYNGTSVRDIARAADVSEALLYKHFPSKEELYNQIQRYSKNVSLIAACDKIKDLDQGAEALVGYVYLIMMLILTEVPGMEKDQAWHERLLYRSLLRDNVFARKHFNLILKDSNKKIPLCIKTALSNGDMVDTPINSKNSYWFYHHLFMAINLCHLTDKPAFDYEGSLEELADQAVFFSLRGLGMTDNAINKYYDPKKLKKKFKKIFLNEQ